MRKILIVVPTVVLWNWKAEAEKWLDKPAVQIISNGKVELDPLATVVIVTHGLLLNNWILSQLTSETWGALIVDEAHAFKTEEAKRTIALYTYLAKCADRIWLLSGTPCPNNVGELYTHLMGLSPDRLVVPPSSEPLTYQGFINRFCKWHHTDYGIKITSNRKDTLPNLKLVLEGFILRRMTAEVLPDLPSIRYETVHLRPLKLDAIVSALSKDLSPAVREALADPDDKRGVFDVIKNAEEMARFRRLCGMAKAAPIVELIGQELREGTIKKVVIFAHHKDVVQSIAHGLRWFGVRIITGATPARIRSNFVALFQEDENVQVMVCNIVAGGVGITLTASADVVFAEQSWVPGENAQAAKRCHRIGQDKPVRVRMIALADTLDEDITESNKQKMRMITEVIG